MEDVKEDRKNFDFLKLQIEEAKRIGKKKFNREKFKIKRRK